MYKKLNLLHISFAGCTSKDKSVIRTVFYTFKPFISDIWFCKRNYVQNDNKIRLLSFYDSGFLNLLN